jgi:hypothetical protein
MPLPSPESPIQALQAKRRRTIGLLILLVALDALYSIAFILMLNPEEPGRLLLLALPYLVFGIAFLALVLKLVGINRQLRALQNPQT